MKENLVPKNLGAAEPRKAFYTRLILFVLLLAVPTLSTLAKTHWWYLPAGNAARHLTAAVKIKVTHPVKLAHRTAPLEQQPLLLTAKVIPPRTEIEFLHSFQLETFPLATAHHIDFQHRAPPAAFSL